MNESYLLWLPQYLMCLPLPLNWKKKLDDITNKVIYVHCINQLEIDFHPIEPFAKVIINKARQYYNQKPELLNEIKNKLRMFDNVLRNFTLNMNQVRLFYSLQEKKKRKAIEKRNSGKHDEE